MDEYRISKELFIQIYNRYLATLVFWIPEDGEILLSTSSNTAKKIMKQLEVKKI